MPKLLPPRAVPKPTLHTAPGTGVDGQRVLTVMPTVRKNPKVAKVEVLSNRTPYQPVGLRFRNAISVSIPCQAERCAARAATSGGRQGEHSLHVPRDGDETPLALDIVEAAQKKLAEAHHRFDDSKHRFRGLLAQGVELLAFGRSQTVVGSNSPGNAVGTE